AKIVDEIQVMRKTVVDGSNVSGFQRTALVGYDGKLETSKGIIRIPTICLEEEAAQKITETKEHTKYRLDRLGIPLIEIATDVDIKDNEHAKEVAEKLGMILRSTGKVKRGIGTIRQDVNVSIKGRERVEIKGFQELRSMSKVIEKEVKRQSSLKKKEQSHVRKVESDGSTTYLRPMSGAARMYPETDVMPIKPDIKHIKIPKLISDKIKHISKKYKISEDMARLLLKHNVDLDYYVKRYPNLKPLLITEMFVTTPKEIRKRHNVELDIWKHGDEVLEKLNQGVISKDAVVDILVDLAKGKKIDYSKFKTVDDKKLEAEVKNIVESKKGLGFGAYMGILMGKYKGKVDGKKLSELLKKYVK
ncbi:hypothetical protein HQ529_04650, partial [Candidatus Woesearchaeota archaeon]|nr:hypothetical protein [Candidatus Woesearchaeota archaeon]